MDIKHIVTDRTSSITTEIDAIRSVLNSSLVCAMQFGYDDNGYTNIYIKVPDYGEYMNEVYDSLEPDGLHYVPMVACGEIIEHRNVYSIGCHRIISYRVPTINVTAFYLKH